MSILDNKNVMNIIQSNHKETVAHFPFTPKNFEKNKPTEIILKPEILDLSKLEEGEGNKNIYRPKSFNEYIGQEEAKQRVEDYIVGSQKYNEDFPHTFLSAPSGCGKTTFALILATLLNKKFVMCTAGDIKSEQQMVDKITECDGGIIFLDEAHKLKNIVATFLLPILEDFQVQGRNIKHFTMILATTHKGNLTKNLEALIQRFLPIDLMNYEFKDLVTITKQFHQKKYKDVVIPEEIFNDVANNCRLTPRIAQRLFKEYVYTLDWIKVLRNNHIVKDGITSNDIKALKYLKQTEGAGQASLAKYLRVEPNTYAFEIEPFLIYKEFITVENKRKLTKLGEEFLKGLDK